MASPKRVNGGSGDEMGKLVEMGMEGRRLSLKKNGYLLSRALACRANLNWVVICKTRDAERSREKVGKVERRFAK